MFIEHHHKNYFPIITVAITLILTVVVIFLFVPTVKQHFIAVKNAPVVSLADYERNAGLVIETLDARLEVADSNAARESVVGASSNALLELIVPAAYQSVHLELVISLNLMQRGYNSGDSVQAEEGMRRLESIRSQYDWI